MIDDVDVAMPTHESAGVVGETLDRLAAVAADCDAGVNRLVVVDDESADDTRAVVRERADRHGWPLRLVTAETSLPEARELLAALAETEWLLFLDDDVRLGARYLDRLAAAAAPGVGGVQGRKASRDESPTDWVRRRARRGGTHATLVRADPAVAVSFPDDLHVLEDEYLRRHVESEGYLWVFNHQAAFAHANQYRHPIGWQEGYLAGKYGLKPFHEVALNVPFAAATGRSPVPHAKRAAGWLAGRVVGGDASPGERKSVDDTDHATDDGRTEVEAT
jgi:glycosyltransferase involved in cell wall biosynthesis